MILLNTVCYARYVESLCMKFSIVFRAKSRWNYDDCDLENEGSCSEDPFKDTRCRQKADTLTLLEKFSDGFYISVSNGRSRKLGSRELPQAYNKIYPYTFANC